MSAFVAIRYLPVGERFRYGDRTGTVVSHGAMGSLVTLDRYADAHGTLRGAEQTIWSAATDVELLADDAAA